MASPSFYLSYSRAAARLEQVRKILYFVSSHVYLETHGKYGQAKDGDQKEWTANVMDQPHYAV